MPKGTKVHRCFVDLRAEMGEGKAARVCQASTGQSLRTGKKKRKKKRKRG